MDKMIPVTIITGFLGAGKTTPVKPHSQRRTRSEKSPLLKTSSVKQLSTKRSASSPMKTKKQLSP